MTEALFGFIGVIVGAFVPWLQSMLESGKLISMECGLQIPDTILKYDGRPFFYNELLSRIQKFTK